MKIIKYIVVFVVTVVVHYFISLKLISMQTNKMMGQWEGVDVQTGLIEPSMSDKIWDALITILMFPGTVSSALGLAESMAAIVSMSVYGLIAVLLFSWISGYRSSKQP